MKFIITTIMMLLPMISWAAEPITIMSPYSASHSGTPAMLKIIDAANQKQSQYRFLLEFKPGGEQILAVKAIEDQPNNRLAIIAPKYVEHVESGRLNESNYVPVHALGDACWAVITNVGDGKQGVSSLRSQSEIVVGGVGFGNAAHLTSLQLAERYGFHVRYVPFKSNYDALLLMAGDGSINMVVDRVNSYHQLKEKQPGLRILAMSCPNRHPDEPGIKTLAEQGIIAPYVFNITIAHKNMDAGRRTELGQILQDATQTVGLKEIQKLSDMNPPVFNNVNIQTYYVNSINIVKTLLRKHQNKIGS